MGYGSYTSADWYKLKESKGINSSSNATQIFKSKSMSEKFDPKYINMRESRDSADSPEATPVIIGFDVTGSMGYLAEEIAKNALNKTVTQIYEKQPITNPHIMCAAIGDVVDSAPLQVTQFEADIRIVEQLMELWLESGGGDWSESYNLLWYFADKHTKTDCFEKRRKKGFLFTIGDAPTHYSLYSEDIHTIFNDTSMTYTNLQLIKSVSEKYEVFHIITKARDEHVFNQWSKILPGRVAKLDENGIQFLSELIISIMQITNGADKEVVINQWDDTCRLIISKAVEEIEIVQNDEQHSRTKQTPIKKSFFSKIFRR